MSPYAHIALAKRYGYSHRGLNRWLLPLTPLCDGGEVHNSYLIRDDQYFRKGPANGD